LSTSQTLYSVNGAIATLTFNRPEARNAMTWEMYQALVDACHRVEGDAAIRVLVLRGAGGKAFISGTDIAQFEQLRTEEDALAYEARIDEVLDTLERVSKATIAQVQGVAAGGGCAIALTCDLRVATPESTFGIPIARTLGNCLSGTNYGRLLDMMGPTLAKDMLLTGRFISGTEAHGRGFVSRIETADTIDQAVDALATQIAGNAPLTLRTTKEMIRRLTAARRLPPGADHDLVTRCYTSADFREGVTAFLSKRKPRWSGV
jgi:enoyl-CoA hydratase/carnithine racemase